MDSEYIPTVAICVVRKVSFKVLNHLLVQYSVMGMGTEHGQTHFFLARTN